MHRGYCFKLYPTPEQAETLGQWVGVTRLVYNLALEQRRDFWRQFQRIEGQRISFASQCRELTELRAACDWIEAVPRMGVEAALHDLDLAFVRYFKGSGFPTPRRLGENDSIRFRGRETAERRLNGAWSAVRLPKLGWIKLRRSREIAGRILTVTIQRRCGAWEVVFACDVGAAPAYGGGAAVGIDRGVANTLSLSTGEHVRLPDVSHLECKRRKAQRVLARRKRGSKRYAAQKKRVAHVAARIARVRAHHLHVASRSIAGRFATVALEALAVTRMTARARGTPDNPLRGRAQKSGLNRSILAQGWTLFARQLDYKLEAAGGRLIYVPAAYTSQTCAECGVVDARSRKSQAVFACVACGHGDHADTNAARNIMRGSTALVEDGHHFKPADEARTLTA